MPNSKNLSLGPLFQESLRGSSTKVKLTAIKDGAFREGISFYIVPLNPALNGGAWGALAGQRDPNVQNKPLRKTLLNSAPFHLPIRHISFTPLML
jgi:hypothetical protein